MRVPDRLVSLVEDGIVEEVVRPLMSGKEAQVFLVIAGGEERVAKVYKESTQRLFKHRTEYTEGRRTRNSRDQRAMGKRSKHGREKDEKSWQTAEVDMIYRLKDAGVRVPTPYSFMDGVLVMEMITDAEGNPAPQIGTLQFGRKDALAVFDLLIQEVVRMLCAGVIHGDLSDFNVLMSADGPVVIDFPQAVDSANNPGARKLLIRDVDNLHRFVGRFVTGLRRLPYAEEMWELYERGELTKDTKLEGTWAPPKHVADVDAVLREIDTAEREEWERREQLSGDSRDLRSGVDSRRGPTRRDRGPTTPNVNGAATPSGAKSGPQPRSAPPEPKPNLGGGGPASPTRPVPTTRISGRGDERTNTQRSDRGPSDNGRRTPGTRDDGPGSRGQGSRRRRPSRGSSSGRVPSRDESRTEGSGGQTARGPNQRADNQRNQRADNQRNQRADNQRNQRADNQRNQRADNQRDQRADNQRDQRADNQRDQRADNQRNQRPDNPRDQRADGPRGRPGRPRSGDRRPQERRGDALREPDRQAPRGPAKDEGPRDVPSGQDRGSSSSRPRRRSSRGSSSSRRR